MPILKLCVIQYGNRPFLAGGEVTGRLLVDVEFPTVCNYIQVQLDGTAHTQWYESYSEETSSVRCTETQTIVSAGTVVWDGNRALRMLQPGNYDFPFRFLLPPHLPSSFEGRSGHIRYHIQGRIATGMRSGDYVATYQLPLSNVINTANDPVLQDPQVAEKVKKVGPFSLSGRVAIKARIERTGFAIGDSIPLIVEIANHSSRPVRVSAFLRQRITYHAREVAYPSKEHSRHEDTQLATPDDTITSGVVPPHTTSIWSPNLSESLKVPATTYPTLSQESCTIIQISHLLCLKTHIPHSFSSKIKIPIVIGNVLTRMARYGIPPFVAPSTEALATYIAAQPSAPPLQIDSQDSTRIVREKPSIYAEAQDRLFS